jgi:hypothetical protein
MKIALIGAAALAAAAFATPALAQRVISNPAYCENFYPNANCQNYGPGNPYTDPNYPNYQRNSWQNDNAYMEPYAHPRVHHHHRKHHG